ncbi:MAG TPA: hypothetical protein PKM63_21545 [Panacibacter sp.]|nr:hypothetical protein [Panacibacter sp.]HNP46897.1 hypothetical protein [Panacibacter sp.]
MSTQNRDLLVLTKRVTMKPGELKHEIERIIELLGQFENMDAYCVANEVIDLNRYKIIQKHYAVMRILREPKLKPFVFIVNKN